MARQYNFTDAAVTATDDAASPNSATLQLYQGDLSISGLVPGGQAEEDYESQGEWTGSRKGARAYPTVTMTGVPRGSMSAFSKLCAGLTSGFTSVADSISDYPHVDLDITWTHNAVTYQCVLEDCALQSIDLTDGSPLTEPFTFNIKGPVTIEGETWISSR